MASTPAKSRELLYFARSRECLPYAYGGAFSRNVSDSTDCSGLIFSAAAILVGLDPYRRYGSTETLRMARINRVAAPCGLLPAKDAASVPANAALKVGVQHGGGGPNSHTSCSFLVDGIWFNWESRGYPGVILNRCGTDVARAWNDPMFNDFWYLPPVEGSDPVTAFPLPDGFYYGPQDGPYESISGKSGEPHQWIERFKLWQAKAGDIADGTYDAGTTGSAAKKVQSTRGLPVTGLVDRKTWEAIMGGPVVAKSSEQMIKETFEQLAGFDPSGNGAFVGWPQLGGRTIVNALAAIGEKLGIPGFTTR